jgi:FtsP/CotA-like multicopper oxidase with cupredoxin domain
MKFKELSAVGVCVFALGACGDGNGPEPYTSVELEFHRAAQFEAPPSAWDLNWKHDTVETVLVARPGIVSFDGETPTEVWTYNGGTPGPTIEADVGDTVVVHFFNRLPEETTIHWHGLELPAQMDGTPLAQPPVEPGGYFRYEFKVTRAATYWYHPHVRSHEQVEKGRYGMLVVRDKHQDRELGLPRRAHQLVLDDILLDDDGSIAEPFPADPLENAAMQVNGREGNTLLVNGQVQPTQKIRAHQPQRLRLVNSSNSRFMRVAIDGHTMYRVGGDGGLLQAPLTVPDIEMIPGNHEGQVISNPDLSQGLLLTPGERADVVFTPNHRGEINVTWHDVPRGRHSASYADDGSIMLGHLHQDGAAAPQTLMTFNAVGRLGDEFVPPSELRDIEPIDVTGAAPLPLMFGHTPANPDGDVTFFVQMKDGAPLPFPAIQPEDAPTVSTGETRIWQVVNMTGGDHNFHPHGFIFQHLETEYVDMDTPENNYVVPAAYLEDKDTIHLLRRPGAMGRSRTITRLAVRFDDTGREGQIGAYGKNPSDDMSGGWAVHCHLLEHAERGMMTFLQVVDP